MLHTKIATIFTLLLLATNPVYAEVEENYCLNKDMAKNNEGLARKNSEDPIIVKLVALRSGLCELVDKGIIDTEFAIDLFDAEKSKGFFKRLEEDVENNRELGA